jgi:hypothetical protein
MYSLSRERERALQTGPNHQQIADRIRKNIRDLWKSASRT